MIALLDARDSDIGPECGATAIRIELLHCLDELIAIVAVNVEVGALGL